MLIWRHQFKCVVARPGHDHVAIHLPAINPHTACGGFDPEPQCIWPHIAGLVQGAAIALAENLQIIGPPFIEHATKTAGGDLVVTLFPLGQVLGLFIHVVRNDGAPGGFLGCWLVSEMVHDRCGSHAWQTSKHGRCHVFVIFADFR